MDPIAVLRVYLISLGIGLLIGLERERARDQAAGLRTFALVALLGTTSALITSLAETPWMIPASLLAVLIAAVAADWRDPRRTEDPGYTSIIALLLCHLFGALLWYGYVEPVVTLAITVTLLLYLKPELHEFSHKVSRSDMRSILQFMAIAFMLLPLLPDQGYGPWEVLNPFRIGLLVTLISGLSLAGYVVLKWFGGQRALALVGLLGGAVSSTATTLAFSRHRRAGTLAADNAAFVVLLANQTVLIRLAIIASAAAPATMPALLPMLGCALVTGSLLPLRLHRQLSRPQTALELDVRNPAELRSALGFALVFALVLLTVAWVNQHIGNAGLYVVALVSGLTDVDAISLSTLQLFRDDQITRNVAISVVALAYTANLAFKFGMVVSLGGREMARTVGRGFLSTLAGLLVGWLGAVLI